MNTDYSLMESNINMLGALLDDAITRTAGHETFERFEHIKKLAQQSQTDNLKAQDELINIISNLTNEELLPIARAFNHFLNLANTATEYYGISPHGEAMSSPSKLSELFNHLKSLNMPADAITSAIDNLSIELVLTAHPTEINRRTLINTYTSINNCLAQLDHNDLADYEIDRIMRRLKQLVCQAWFTDEIRKSRPTPIDEAKWGFSVIEDSLWQGVPLFLREFNDQLTHAFNQQLPAKHVPIKFSSWMGGDRDGNPNVTAKITEKIILQARIKAVDLFLGDIKILVRELSMTHCSREIYSYLENENKKSEPYRSIMKKLRDKLTLTKDYLTAKLEGKPTSNFDSKALILSNKQLWEPLYACYKSLIACNMSTIAHGPLLDTLRRIKSFGLELLKLDIRQESSAHTKAIDALTKELNIGSYESWNEHQRQTFLLAELEFHRPLMPYNWEPEPAIKEIFDTCKVIAKAGDESISAYVISMAKTPSDVLAVYLLLKIVNCDKHIPVVPLFETLADLNNAKSVMKQLLDIPWYQNKINGKQMVMIGYSDSAKDAGTLAASWAQYRTQEDLVSLFGEYRIDLTLFHGRGGTIGRGGAPAHAALLSQPPGSLKSGLRVTEQGEMIRFKLGLPDVALSSLMLYTSAILQANFLPPPNPKQAWRLLMDDMSKDSCEIYRSYIQEEPLFIPFFKNATPESELARLPLGSRPPKRKQTEGIENLRAIPWIFAWTQNRLMLPSWLGAGTALKNAINNNKEAILKDMYKSWPFFNTRLGMLEMVYTKADTHIYKYYQTNLVDKTMWHLGDKLCNMLNEDINIVLKITDDKSLMADLPWIAKSVTLRNHFIEPLNLLQVELLKRSRLANKKDETLEQALMITISGIAAGMRNSG